MKTSKRGAEKVSTWTADEAFKIERAIDGRAALGAVEILELDEDASRISIIPGASLNAIRDALAEFGADVVAIDGDEFRRVRVVRS